MSQYRFLRHKPFHANGLRHRPGVASGFLTRFFWDSTSIILPPGGERLSIPDGDRSGTGRLANARLSNASDDLRSLRKITHRGAIRASSAQQPMSGIQPVASVLSFTFSVWHSYCLAGDSRPGWAQAMRAVSDRTDRLLSSALGQPKPCDWRTASLQSLCRLRHTLRRRPAKLSPSEKPVGIVAIRQSTYPALSSWAL